jgi:hypothetical protein
MSRDIGDEAAITFSAAFYRAFGFGRTIQEAFEQGKVALHLAGIPEYTTPHLLVKDGVVPAQIRMIPSTEEIAVDT